MRKRPRNPFAIAEEAAIGEVNTTPLIDVILVLLILCVISIPLMNHKVTIQLPAGPGTVEPAVHRLALDAQGRLTWDGAPTTLAALPRQLQILEPNQDSMLEISTDGAPRYEDFDRMLVVVKKSGVDRIGFRGLRAYD